MLALLRSVMFIIAASFVSMAANLDGKREVFPDLLALESARVPGPTARDLQELRGDANELGTRLETLERWMHNQEMIKERESNKAEQENAAHTARTTALPKQKPTGKLNKLWRGFGNAGRFVRRCVTNLCRN